MQLNKTIAALATLLFFSLAGNAFMGSMILGNNFRDNNSHCNKEWMKKDQSLREQLSDADAKTLRDAMEGARDKFMAARQMNDAARDKVEAAQNADPFDEKALNDAIQEEQKTKTVLLKLMRETREEAMIKLSPQGQEILKKMHRQMGGFLNGQGRDGRGGAPGGRFMKRLLENREQHGHETPADADVNRPQNTEPPTVSPAVP